MNRKKLFYIVVFIVSFVAVISSLIFYKIMIDAGKMPKTLDTRFLVTSVPALVVLAFGLAFEIPLWIMAYTYWNRNDCFPLKITESENFYNQVVQILEQENFKLIKSKAIYDLYYYDDVKQPYYVFLFKEVVNDERLQDILYTIKEGLYKIRIICIRKARNSHDKKKLYSYGKEITIEHLVVSFDEKCVYTGTAPLLCDVKLRKKTKKLFNNLIDFSVIE